MLHEKGKASLQLPRKGQRVLFKDSQAGTHMSEENNEPPVYNFRQTCHTFLFFLFVFTFFVTLFILLYINSRQRSQTPLILRK